MRNKAQEEMIGFALIVIIVAIIILAFLALSLHKEQKEPAESYEVESFLQSLLQYTTDCRDNNEYLTIQKLIFDCSENEKCADERDTCEVINSTLRKIIEKGWEINEEAPINGYELGIKRENSGILLIDGGNKTNDYKSAVQDFSRIGESFNIYFTAYY